jgi:DNA-binding MarR family transcriptional regulator
MTSSKNVDALTQIIRDLGMLFTQIASRQSAGHAAITKQELSAIGILGVRGACRIGEIAELLGVSQSAATPIVDRLESSDLVHRSRGHDDRRVWFVELTQEGNSLFLAQNELYRVVAATMLAPLDISEEKMLVALLSKMETPDFHD